MYQIREYAGPVVAGGAAEESGREGLGIRFVSLFPLLTPATALGAVFAAYLRPGMVFALATQLWNCF